jgi:hypothetical protein
MGRRSFEIAEYCIMAEVGKKFEKKVRKKSFKKSSKKCLKKSLLKKFENITNCWREGREGGREGREGGELSFQCLRSSTSFEAINFVDGRRQKQFRITEQSNLADFMEPP